MSDILIFVPSGVNFAAPIVSRRRSRAFAEKGLKRGGFWKGAIASWVLVLIGHAAAYFAVLQPWIPQDIQTPVMALAYSILPLCHLVVPVLGGFFYGA